MAPALKPRIPSFQAPHDPGTAGSLRGPVPAGAGACSEGSVPATPDALITTSAPLRDLVTSTAQTNPTVH